MPILELSPIEARILGCLVEKSLTTPDLYPLTFNSLLAACNQKTSREPVMDLDVDALGKGVQSLAEKGLLERSVVVVGSRVPKFKHRIEALLGGDAPRLVAAMTLLLLRGPQTPGEIKNRAERLHKFESTAEVEALFQELCAKPEPMIARLPRLAGQKEPRYQHLFSGAAPVSAAESDAAPAPAADAGLAERVEKLERRVEALEALLQAAAPAPAAAPQATPAS